MLSKQEEQQERLETLENDRRVREQQHREQQQKGTTFHQHAIAFADETNQGRFAATGKPQVIGSTGAPPRIPQLPPRVRGPDLIRFLTNPRSAWPLIKWSAIDDA